MLKEASKTVNEFEKKRMVYSIFGSMLVCGTLYLNIASFFPLFVAEFYAENINQSMVACALCCFQFAGVICTPIHAITISKMGRKNAMMIGFGAILISNTVLGMLSKVNPKHWKAFLFMSCLTRFI